MEDGPGADRPLHELDDAELLRRVRSMFERRDPVPSSVVERAKLTIRLRARGAEPASPVSPPEEPPAPEPGDSG